MVERFIDSRNLIKNMNDFQMYEEGRKEYENSQDADISNVSNPFKVYTYSFFDNSKGFKPKHWAKDLTIVIEKDGVKMKLEGKEIQELVASLPRTFGGSY